MFKIERGREKKQIEAKVSSINRFESPQQEKLQVPHEAAVVGEFDTLHIIDDIHVPKGKWGEADWLEPVTKDFPQYGEGGATQAITYGNIKLDNVKDLRR